ncbi:MAG: excinuclease ABC subunit UvrC [Verrucomicrobiota bacterium]
MSQADGAKQALKIKVRNLPHKPGVYIYRDRLGRVLYVGKAKDLRKRVSQYFHPSRRMKADRKTLALVDSIFDLDFHEVKSDAEAVLLEGRLIKEFRPKYNVLFRDDKRFFMVKVHLGEPYPRFQLTRIRKDDGARYFGPYPSSGALKRTLDVMRRRFSLRTCRPRLPGEKDYKHCNDDVIRNCSAPCIEKVSREEYLGKIEEACDFLEGKTGEIIEQLDVDMQRAAAKLDFEKAAELRDLMDAIKQTTKKQKRFLRDVPEIIIPEKDLRELRDVLNLQAIPEVMECFDISNISTTHVVASMVCFRHGKPDRSSYRRYRIKSVEGQDDFASMAEVIRRRYARVKKETLRVPDLIVVDGGKGQLSSAVKELNKIGMHAQPVIGLAKKREEIFRPMSRRPLTLSLESGAVRMLQRIRDEAHRFANGYHQLLMKKRITESLLDDCPGISQKRKMELLRHFGSLQKIRKATLEELAEVDGISEKIAQGILDYFRQLTSQSAASDKMKQEDEVDYVLKLG